MQFDVHDNHRVDQTSVPYLVDVQANLLSDLQSRVLVPLVPVSIFGVRVRRLHPVLTLFGADFVLATHLLASLDQRRLRPVRTSLVAHRDSIVAAIDVLLAGV